VRAVRMCCAFLMSGRSMTDCCVQLKCSNVLLHFAPQHHSKQCTKPQAHAQHVMLLVSCHVILLVILQLHTRGAAAAVHTICASTDVLGMMLQAFWMEDVAAPVASCWLVCSGSFEV
jgi:hypothetical protein